MGHPTRERVRTPLRASEPILGERFAEHPIHVNHFVEVWRANSKTLGAELVGPAGDHLELRDCLGRISPCSNLPIAPRLLRDPFERVETIWPIEIERQI